MYVIEGLSVEQCYLLMVGYRRNCFYDVAEKLGLSMLESQKCFDQMKIVFGEMQ